MERKVKYYQVQCDNDTWLKIIARYESHLSPLRVVFFRESEHDVENRFLRFCSELGLCPRAKLLLESTGKPLWGDFYYWAVRDSQEYAQDFIQFSCDGGGKGMCWYGAEQVQKVTISPPLARKVITNGVIVKNFPIAPRVYLITRKLKQMIEAYGLSGVIFTPCLISGRHYSDQEKSFATILDKLETEAEIFQLRITQQTLNKPQIGKTIAASFCSKCGTAMVMEGEKEFEFEKGSLATTDFQSFSGVISEEKDFQIMGEIPILSSRALTFFLDLKVKGIKNYSSDPPIKYAVVQVYQN